MFSILYRIYRVDRLNYAVEVFLEIPEALIGALAIADSEHFDSL